MSGGLKRALAVCTAFAAFGAVAAAEAPPGRYTITSDTVKDNRTGLTWQRYVDAAPTGCGGDALCTQTEAVSYCNGLVLPPSGFSDWRLPTVAELLSIVDRTNVNPAIDTTAFPSTPSAPFWTSSAYVGNSGIAWGVNSGYGYSGLYTVGSVSRVRCVR